MMGRIARALGTGGENVLGTPVPLVTATFHVQVFGTTNRRPVVILRSAPNFGVQIEPAAA